MFYIKQTFILILAYVLIFEMIIAVRCRCLSTLKGDTEEFCQASKKSLKNISNIYENDIKTTTISHLTSKERVLQNDGTKDMSCDATTTKTAATLSTEQLLKYTLENLLELNRLLGKSTHSLLVAQEKNVISYNNDIGVTKKPVKDIPVNNIAKNDIKDYEKVIKKRSTKGLVNHNFNNNQKREKKRKHNRSHHHHKDFKKLLNF